MPNFQPSSSINYTGSIKGISSSAVVTGGDVGGNLILQSENLATNWGFLNTSPSVGVSYLDGTTTFWKLVENNTTNGLHDAYSSKFNVAAGEVITVSACVAAGERDIVDIGVLYSPWSGAVASRYPQMIFNLTTGTLVQGITSPVSDAGITQIGTLSTGQKVYRIYVTTVPANFTVTNGGGVYCRVHQSDVSPSYSGIIGNGAYFTRFQANKNLLSNYIKTTTTAIENTAKTTDAFNETIKYRQDVSPSSDPTGLAITQTATADGNVVYKLSYSYSPGSIPADLLITYVKEGGGTISPGVTSFSTNAVTGDMSFVLKPNTNYRFGAQAARRTERGLLGGNIISTADITPTATSNFAGNIDGSPASQIRSGTVNYRQDVSPTNDPTISPNAQVATADGNVVARISYGYSQGAIPADFILIYVKENGGVISSSTQSYSTNPVSGDMSFVLKPSTTYRFGVQAVRRTESGLKGGNIVSTADIALTSPNYTGLIAGSPAAAVAVNARDGATAFTGTSKYRTVGAPTNLVVPTGVTTTSNSNATKNIRVSWAAYIQGANQADVIGLFYRKDNLVPSYTDSCITMNVNINTPGYYEFLGVNPTDTYSFGIAAGRRTESGTEWGLINTTYGTGPFYLYGDDLVATSPNISVSNVTNITNDFTPNGEPVFLVTDADAVNLQSAGWSSTITAPGSSTRFLAEAFIKQNTTANIPNGLLQIWGSNNSYRNVSFSYATGAILGTSGPSTSPETYTETINTGSANWYRIGISAIMSPDITQLSAYFYPALHTSPSISISPDLTGSGTIGGVVVRRISNTNSGFDWTGITADTAANFTGNVYGTTAETLAQQPVFESYGPATFDFRNSTNGFTTTNANITTQSDSIIVSPTATDPQIRKTGLSFSGSTYQKVRARVRRVSGSAAWEGTVYYTTSSGPSVHGESGTYLKQIAAPSSPAAWNIVEWDMATSTSPLDWLGSTISGLRFDFSQSPDSNWEVDWISVGRTGIPTYGADYGSSPSNLIGLSGDGINRVLRRYSGGWQSNEYDDSAGTDKNKYVVLPSTKDANISACLIGTSNGTTGPTAGFYGTKALKVTGATGSARNCYFASSATTYNMSLVSNSKWILSAKVWAAVASTPVILGLKTASASYPLPSVTPTIATWTDISGVLNLTADSNTSGLIYVNIGNTATNNVYTWFDGIMLERKVGPGTTPSRWVSGVRSSLDSNVSTDGSYVPEMLGVGTFLAGMRMNQGNGVGRGILHGLYQGFAKDNDVITFANPYDSTVKPAIMFYPGAWLGAGDAYSPRMSGVYNALNVTNTGFTASLKITGTSASTTAVSDNFSPAASTSPFFGGDLASPANYTINKSSNLEAVDDKYTFSYSTTITNLFAPPYYYASGTATIDLYIRTVTGWTKVASVTHNGTAGQSTTTISPISYTATLDGAVFSGTTGSSPVFALDLVNSTFGATASFIKVTYTTSATTPSSVSATSTSSSSVPYVVMANSFTE